MPGPAGRGGGLTVGPRRGLPAPLLELCERALGRQLVRVAAGVGPGSWAALRAWLLDLPAHLRAGLMDRVWAGPGPPATTRPQFQRAATACWGLLYSGDWERVELPDLRTGPGGPCGVERVLARLGLSPAQPELYTELLAAVVAAGPGRATRLCVGGAGCGAGAGELLASLPALLPRLTVLRLGRAGEDDILVEAGRHCPGLRVVQAGGPHLTDRGLAGLCGTGEGGGLWGAAGGRSAICSSLVSLALPGAGRVTVAAVLDCLISLPRLARLEVEPGLLGRLLARPGPALPAPCLELSLGRGRPDLLGPASHRLPRLQESLSTPIPADCYYVALEYYVKRFELIARISMFIYLTGAHIVEF